MSWCIWLALHSSFARTARGRWSGIQLCVLFEVCYCSELSIHVFVVAARIRFYAFHFPRCPLSAAFNFKNSPFVCSVRLHSSRPGPRSASKHRVQTALSHWRTLGYLFDLIYVRWHVLHLLLLYNLAEFLIQNLLFAAGFDARADWHFANSSLTPSLCKRSLYQSLLLSVVIQKQEHHCAHRLAGSVSWSPLLVLRRDRVRARCFPNLCPHFSVFGHCFYENMFLMSIRNLCEEKIRDSMLLSSVRYSRFGVRSHSFACSS